MNIFQHPVAFYRGVSASIDAENAKASAYLTHGAALGTARERILRRTIRELTPSSLSIDTGFIHCDGKLPSRQCDLLVHDQHSTAAKYRIDDLVVVAHLAARAVVEVKSDLDSQRFGEAMDVYYSIKPFWQPYPVFGPTVPCVVFAYDGVTFDTAIEYIKNRFKHVANSVPNALVIHACNTLFLRGSVAFQPTEYSVNCLQFPSDKPGLATAHFLEWYRQLLADPNEMAQENIDGHYRVFANKPDVKYVQIKLRDPK